MSNEPQFDDEEMKMPEQKPERGTAEEETQGGSGAVIFILFVLLAAILVGMYFWYQAATQTQSPTTEITRPSLENNNEPETPTATAETQGFGVMSTSDEISVIEADLESTDLNNLEAELLQIETELGATN